MKGQSSAESNISVHNSRRIDRFQKWSSFSILRSDRENF